MSDVPRDPESTIETEPVGAPRVPPPPGAPRGPEAGPPPSGAGVTEPSVAMPQGPARRWPTAPIEPPQGPPPASTSGAWGAPPTAGQPPVAPMPSAPVASTSPPTGGSSADSTRATGATTTTSAPRWVTPFVILAALALFAGGALSGWAIAQRDDADGTPTAATELADGATTPVSGPVADDVQEPVAAVADAVAPSVVQIETDSGLGSGIVYDDQGHILTAAHVLDGATQLRVRLADGTLVAAEIVGTNEATDVGVVAIDPPAGLEPAVLGVDADVTVGQIAVAVGSPFGLEQTVTSGIVSAVDRPVETEGTSLVGMIQTDASINPGNSGGALADRNGRIIGINDAIRTAGGGNEGVGFAIPIDLAVRVADQIISGEDIRAGLLGVTVGDPTDGPPGALINEVMAGGPAADSDLETGDLITGIDGESVSQMQELRARVLALEPGTTVVLDVLRDGEQLEIEVTLGSATD